MDILELDLEWMNEGAILTNLGQHNSPMSPILWWHRKVGACLCTGPTPPGLAQKCKWMNELNEWAPSFSTFSKHHHSTHSNGLPFSHPINILLTCTEVNSCQHMAGNNWSMFRRLQRPPWLSDGSEVCWEPEDGHGIKRGLHLFLWPGLGDPCARESELI